MEMEKETTIHTDPTTPHRACEPLIYEIGAPTRRGFALPPLDVPAKPMESWIPASHLRTVAAPLPEVSERELVQHFMRLAHLNFSVETNFYPLGSCTM
ncbi:MAG: hypothetical protein HY594_03920, partial [Candidatus Omnitrophica bacterium]|nr:hypothetical protein [Candidatus Omnitrophota bacterium]